jgi:GGDEF domain-containing protein
MVVVAEAPAPDLIDALSAAGAFPIVEACWSEARAAFIAAQPSAVILAEPGPASNPDAAQALAEQIDAANGPYIPVVGRSHGQAALTIPGGLPIDADASATRLVARLRTALRVRSLHATVLRRIEALKSRPDVTLPSTDPIEDATVLVTGRGGSYPALAVAVGERVGLIGALSVETAGRYLNSREVDGVVIGDGFSERVMEALLTLIAEDPRFRDLPVFLLGGTPMLAGEFAPQLTNLERFEGDPAGLVEWMLPLVRLHAFDARLKRVLKTLDSNGVIDAETGLLTRDAFWRDLAAGLREAAQRGIGLSLARFSFGPTFDRRASMDTARLVSRVVRNMDFACQGADGSILCVFTETDLRSAHVIARRIASILKQTMLTSDRGQPKLETNITLGALKPTDTVESLLQRVGAAAFAA